MVRGRRKGVLIAGGGVAGSLAAIALARLRPDVPLMIVEEQEHFGGERFHYLFDEEQSEAERALIAPIVEHRWPGFYVNFPGKSRNLKGEVSGFATASLHRTLIETLSPDQYRLGARIVAVRGDALELEGGEVIKAEGIIDARGVTNLSMLDLLYETRVERLVRLEQPHLLDRPLIIDATVEQTIGLSFVQAFPVGPDRLRIAKLLVSERSQPDEVADARLDHYLDRRGWKVAEEEERFAASSPLPHGGDFSAFWRIGGARVAKLGMRGGFLQPATGRTAADAARNALLLTEQKDFSSDALHDLFEEQARQQWKKRELQRAYVQALAAAPPEQRRSLAERLYQLDRGVILRFLADRLGLIERRQVQKLLKG